MAAQIDPRMTFDEMESGSSIRKPRSTPTQTRSI